MMLNSELPPSSQEKYLGVIPGKSLRSQAQCAVSSKINKMQDIIRKGFSDKAEHKTLLQYKNVSAHCFDAV